MIVYNLKMLKNLKSNSKKSQTTKAEPKQKKHLSLGGRIILRIVTILVIAAILAVVFFFVSRKYKNPTYESRYALVEKQLSYCQELVTVKYRYSDIATIKKSAGFSKSYSIVKYTGIIRAGIADITDISYNVSLDGKKLRLKIPQAEILGNEIVKQEIFDEYSSIFVPITTKEVFDEIKKSQDETCEDLISEGLLEDARNYAIEILTQFMKSVGFEEIEIEELW